MKTNINRVVGVIFVEKKTIWIYLKKIGLKNYKAIQMQ